MASPPRDARAPTSADLNGGISHWGCDEMIKFCGVDLNGGISDWIVDGMKMLDGIAVFCYFVRALFNTLEIMKRIFVI